MLALRLIRSAHPAVHLRRLTVTAAAAATGFLLLSALGYALGHPRSPADAALRLAWCVVPLAATGYLAVAVARADPATRPRPGFSAFGLGPGRLMAVSALTTVLSCALGSMLALMAFLHLRGDITGMPFDGAAAKLLAADEPLPVPAALTLLALPPALASAAVALALRPREPRKAQAGTSRALGRFGRRTPGTAPRVPAPSHENGRPDTQSDTQSHTRSDTWSDTWSETRSQTRSDSGDASAPQDPPSGLPWGVAVLAAGLAVEAYADQAVGGASADPGGGAGVLAGWVLTAFGLILAGPGLTHLCGHLLQTVRPGALRLLAGRGLMAEATRIGRPLGVVCAVASGAYAMTALYGGVAAAFGPLTALGTLQVTGCAVAVLLTAAVEARQSRAVTTDALRRIGAPAQVLRSAAVLRAGALLALFGPLTLVIARLAALPLAP